MKTQKNVKIDVAPFSHEHHLWNKDANILKYTLAVPEQNLHAIIWLSLNTSYIYCEQKNVCD
jgi:hypothetical protein